MAASKRDCKVCASARHREIDAKLAARESTRAVSRWLAESGEDIGYQSLARHAKNHLTKRATQRAARKLLAKASKQTEPEQTPDGDAEDAHEEPVVEAMATKLAGEATRLGEIAEHALSMATFIGREIKRTTTNDRGQEVWVGATLSEANLFTGSLKVATDAIVAREELLGGGKKVKVDVDAKVSGGLAGLFAELEKREAADGGSDKS